MMKTLQKWAGVPTLAAAVLTLGMVSANAAPVAIGGASGEERKGSGSSAAR
jgi:hypothetical protein